MNENLVLDELRLDYADSSDDYEHCKQALVAVYQAALPYVREKQFVLFKNR